MNELTMLVKSCNNYTLPGALVHVLRVLRFADDVRYNNLIDGQPISDDSMNDLSGSALGPYQLKTIIGKGGMATVYRAYQPSMDRDVAIKILAPDLTHDPEFIARFEREAQIIAALQHSHILTVYDFGRANGLIYLVMQLMEGGNLARELKRGAMSPERALRLTRQIATALDYAHRRGIVHRDLKPTNVLLDEQDNAYLTDFGIAKMITGTPAAGLTMTGTVMGTPTYMAPEQWRSEPVDGRTDVYALGIILYQMLAGKVPFHAETPHGLMYQHLDARPPALRSIRPELPPSLEPVLGKALAKRREDRYPSASDLVRDLEHALQSPQRLPEESRIDLPPARPGRTLDDDLHDQMLEDELMALAGTDEEADLQATLPPTAPQPTYEPPQVTIQSPVRVAPPPPYQPPIQGPQPSAPPPQWPGGVYTGPVSESVEPYREPLRGDNPVRGIWMIAAVVIGLVAIIGIAVLGIVLLPGDDTPAEPTAPPTQTSVPTPTTNPALRPNVFITAPYENAAVELGSAVQIEFNASGSQGITRIELRRFGQVLDAVEAGSVPSFQGWFTYYPDSTGPHALEVVARSGDLESLPAHLTIQVR